MTGRTRLAVAVYSVVAVLAAGVGYLWLTQDDDSAPSSGPSVAEGSPWPLTGLTSESGDDLDRPAVAVKVSSGEEARPQAGINQADQVWEEKVEGISRLIAVFHSTEAAPVGPVRSARDSDVDLLGAFGTPVFVWGGANEAVATRVESSPLVSFNVDPDAAENKYRDPQRSAPDNLFIDGTASYFAAEGGTPPVAQFAYRSERAEAGGEPAFGPEIDWGGSRVSYLWDDERGGWIRFQDGTVYVDDQSEIVAPTNVVILLTEYGAAPSDPRSPLAITTGEGEANVFTGGRQITARWSRPSDSSPYIVTDPATGETVELAAGTTWVALAEPGRTSLLDEAQAEVLRGQVISG